MDLSSILYALGATGFFSSRAFIPAFFTSVFLRYGEHVPFMGDLPFVMASGAEPTWFTNNFTILALGVLAGLEVAATKIPEAQEAMGLVHRYAKTGVSALATMGVLGANDVGFIENTISQAGFLDMGLGGIVAGAVWLTSGLRDDTMALFADSDPDDDLGIQRLISWFEDIWSSVGIYFFILYPILILFLVGIFLGFIGLIKIYFASKEEKRRAPCPSCQTLMYGSASQCPSCGTENPDPKRIGFFSQTTTKPAGPLALHRLRLISRRRCSSCATHLKERKLPQQCPTCSTSILADKKLREAYLEMVQGRLPKVLGISFLLSLVPIIGIIPGIIYYRLQLVAPFRMYIPAMRGFLLKWGLRLVFILLISLQLIPGVGGVVVPIMAFLSYSVYRASFNRMISDGEAKVISPAEPTQGA